MNKTILVFYRNPSYSLNNHLISIGFNKVNNRLYSFEGEESPNFEEGKLSAYKETEKFTVLTGKTIKIN